MRMFEEPRVEVIAFEVEDVITTSGNGDVTQSTNCTGQIDPFG